MANQLGHWATDVSRNCPGETDGDPNHQKEACWFQSVIFAPDYALESSWEKTHIHTHTSIHLHLHTCTHVYVHKYICIHIHTSIY